MTALNPLFTFLYFLILSCVSLEERHVVKPSLRIDLFLAHPRLLRPLLRLGLHRRGPLQPGDPKTLNRALFEAPAFPDGVDACGTFSSRSTDPRPCCHSSQQAAQPCPLPLPGNGLRGHPNRGQPRWTGTCRARYGRHVQPNTSHCRCRGGPGLCTASMRCVRQGAQVSPLRRGALAPAV